MFRFLMVTGLFLACPCAYGQVKSDLAVSSHEVVFKGNEVLLKRIADKNREKQYSVFGKIDQICEQSIYQIGKVVVKEETYLVLGLTTSFGNSCRGMNNIVFIKDLDVYGYYRSDVLLAKRIENNRLICSAEDGTETYTINFKHGFPKELEMGKLNNIPFTSIENE